MGEILLFQNAINIKEEVLNQSFLEKDTITWSVKNVSEFLSFNQCASYCDVFLNQVSCWSRNF